MDEDARLARQRPEPTRINGEAGPTGLGGSRSTNGRRTSCHTTASRSAFVSNQTGVARRCRSIPPANVDAADVVADHATLDSFPRAEHMWFIIGVLVGLTATAIFSRLSVPVVHAAKLGWMSQQWLDEHRASRAA